MKKLISIGIVASAIALVLGTATAFAYHGGYGRQFIDQDGDGVCDMQDDLQGNRQNGRFFTDADGDGICDRQNSDCYCGRGRCR